MTIKFIKNNELILGSATIPENVTFRFSDILKLGGGGSSPSWQDIVLSGNGSLTLTNAKANGLNYLKLFGDCEQTGTPTPTVPVDIVCNNGAIKYSANIANVNEQTALIGYYISSSGVVTADQFNWIYQEYIPVLPNTTYTLSFNTSVYYVTISEYTTASDSGFAIRKAGQTGNNTKLTITTGSTTNFVRFGTNIDRTEVTLDRVLTIEWMLNRGSTVLPYTPYVEGSIYTDGTTETVEVSFCDNTIDGQGTFVSPSASTTTRIYKVFGKLQTGHYKIKISSDFQFILQYKDTLEGLPTEYGNIGTWTDEEEFEITDTSMYYGVAIRNASGSGNIYPSTFYNADGKISLNLANNNATAEMLLAISDNKDEQNVTSGDVIRNIGYVIFDGSETFTTSSAYGNACLIRGASSSWGADRSEAVLCTHFFGMPTTTGQREDYTCFFNSTGHFYFRLEDNTVATFKQFLADQYNAGTPVIVFFVKAEPTTETVTGQHLNIQAGTNTVEITQASIDNLGLEVSYKGVN
jgi:hypothetical protein